MFIRRRNRGWPIAADRFTRPTVASIATANRFGRITPAPISSENGVNVGARRAITFSNARFNLAKCAWGQTSRTSANERQSMMQTRPRLVRHQALPRLRQPHRTRRIPALLLPVRHLLPLRLHLRRWRRQLLRPRRIPRRLLRRPPHKLPAPFPLQPVGRCRILLRGIIGTCMRREVFSSIRSCRPTDSSMKNAGSTASVRRTRFKSPDRALRPKAGRLFRVTMRNVWSRI